MSAQKKILGVDFDGVLIECTEAMVEYHNTHYGTSFKTEDMVSFNWGEVWGCGPEEAERRFNDFVTTEFHNEAKEVAGARDALKRLSRLYEVVIVTGRAESAREATVGWLMRNFLGFYREIHFTDYLNTDHSKRRLKSDVVKEVGISVFVDDALPFAIDVTQTGVPVLLFDAPWNQGEVPEGVTRVHSWADIEGRLLRGV